MLKPIGTHVDTVGMREIEQRPTAKRVIQNLPFNARLEGIYLEKATAYAISNDQIWI